MCNCDVCKAARIDGAYVSATYHHGLAEGLYRSDVCECGYWTCGTRGCGACPDCMGEHCVCALLPDYEAPAYDSPFTGGLDGADELYTWTPSEHWEQRHDPGPGLLPTGERVEDMD